MSYHVMPFSKRDQELLQLLSEVGSIEEAAKELRIAEGTVKTKLYRLRQRYDKSQDFIREYRYWKAKLPLRKYL